MINFMKEGEFVKANDVYLLTAIGNAPWPIGLTMVGIHERSGEGNGDEGLVVRVQVSAIKAPSHVITTTNQTQPCG